MIKIGVHLTYGSCPKIKTWVPLFWTTRHIDQRPTTDDQPRILENFERPYLGNGPSDPLLAVRSRLRFSRSADRMALLEWPSL